MSKIARIRQEIERRRLHFNKEAEKYQALNNGYSQNCYGARDALRDLENFLDTLSEEPDKSLEEASYDAVCRIFGCDPMYFGNKAEITARECDYLFRAGAEWQKSQALKAEEGE